MVPKAINFGEADPAGFLAPTPFLQSDNPAVIAFAQQAVGAATTALEKGVRLFYAVRDSIRYNPYNIPATPEGYLPTTVLREGDAYCIPKSNLFAAAARSQGIPALVGFADVRNHLTTKKLLDTVGSDLFIYHGYTVLWLDGKWVKATAAFNLTLCERFGVLPLDFDGKSDALLHPFDAYDRRHMEYLRERGVFPDFPFEEVMAAFRAEYPGFVERAAAHTGRFENETPLTS